MTLETGVFLHVGQGQVTLLEYSLRVGAHLVAFAFVGVAVVLLLRLFPPLREDG